MIPKIIIQTSEYKPQKYVIDKIFEQVSSEYKYLHFVDSEIIEFFNNHFDPEFPDIIQKFNNMQKGCYKADLFRYYFLYIYGGIYIDSDAMIYRNIKDIIKEYKFVSIIGIYTDSVFNGFICTEPKNNIIYKALKHIYAYDHSRKIEDNLIFCKVLKNIIDTEPTSDVKLYKEILDHSHVISVKSYDDDNNVFLIHYWCNY